MNFFGHLAIQQRVLPVYRAAFFDILAQQCPYGLSVFTGEAMAVEGISTTNKLQYADLYHGTNWHLGHPALVYYLCWQWGVLRWLRKWDPAVLIVEANPRYLSTRLAIRWMHNRGRTVLGWGLGRAKKEVSKGKIIERERERFVKNLDGVIAYSHTGAEEYIRMGIPENRVFIAPNAVSAKPKNRIPQRNYLSRNQKTVLFVGRLQHRKRIDLLLAACAALPKNIQPELQIVGDGPARMDFERAAQQIYPQTQFLGACYGEHLADIYSRAHLFVLPGTGGLAAQQALEYGLPLIVAEGDGSQDAYVSEKNGWQIPGDDLDGLKNALEQALSNPERLSSMGEESYRIAVEDVNIERMAQVFLQAINEI